MTSSELSAFVRVRHHRSADPAFLPLHLTGGIGDVLMAIDAVQFLKKRYNLVVYTHHLEAFRYFDRETPSFKDIPELTWRLEFNTTARFHFNEGFHGFLIKDHEDLFLQQQSAFDADPKLETINKSYIKKFFVIAQYAKEKLLDRRQFPMHCLGFSEMLPFSSERRVKQNIITIHDGFDTNHRGIVSGRATKTWDWKHWNALVRHLHYEYPKTEIIQLGASPTARPIDGVDQCLIDKTTINEAFNLVSKSVLHIDGDSGLVHAAARLDTPSIVMWGPTPDGFYGYHWHSAIRARLTCEGSCYGVTENWNDKCPLGYATPICMDAITPSAVMEEARNVLGRRTTVGADHLCSAR